VSGNVVQISAVTFQACKRFGHAWDEIPTPMDWHGRLWPMTWEVEHARCVRCATVRHFQLNGDGEVIARTYDYPPGYKWELPDDKPTRAQLRVLAIGARSKRRRPRTSAAS
jgi:hypothetical protein